MGGCFGTFKNPYQEYENIIKIADIFELNKQINTKTKTKTNDKYFVKLNGEIYDINFYFFSIHNCSKTKFTIECISLNSWFSRNLYIDINFNDILLHNNNTPNNQFITIKYSEPTKYYQLISYEFNSKEHIYDVHIENKTLYDEYLKQMIMLNEYYYNMHWKRNVVQQQINV